MPDGACAKNRQSKNAKIARMGFRAYAESRIERIKKAERGNLSKKVEKIHLDRGQVCIEIKKHLRVYAGVLPYFIYAFLCRRGLFEG